MAISMRSLRSKFHEKLSNKMPTVGKRKPWGQVVFGAFAEMGVEKNLSVWTSRGNIKDKKLLRTILKINGGYLQEYLLDMCWANVDKRNWQSKRLELAMECEWDGKIDALAWDFSKLIDINAPRKVFIFSSAVKKKKEVEDALREMIDSFDRKRLFTGDQILLINLNNEDVKYVCWKVEKSKLITELFDKSMPY